MIGLFTKVYRDLVQRRLRSALTLLGVAAGVAGVVAITSTARNVERAQRQLYASSAQADIEYWVWDAPPGLSLLLASDARIAAAELRWVFTTKWRVDERWVDIELVGIPDFGSVRVNAFELVQGATPRAGEVLLDVSAASLTGVDGPLELALGSALLYRDQNDRERSLTLSGLSRSPSYLSSSITKTAVGYVSADLVRRLLGTAGGNQLLIKLVDPDDARAVDEYVVRLLRRQGIPAGAAQIRDPDNYPGRRELDALLSVMLLFSALGLGLSAFLVANTLSAMVAEQTDEIGTLKVLGATRGQLVGVYLLEALAYGVAGTLVGLAGGVLIGWRLLAWIGALANATVAFRVAPEGLALGLAVGLGVALLGGLAPALRGARISVAQALRSYGIRSDYGAGWLDRWLVRLRRLPPLASLAVRSLSRRAMRSALTLGVVALSTAAFISALATRASVDEAIDEIYSTYAADAWVSLGRSVSPQFADLFTTVEGVRSAEAWAIADGMVGENPARLWGMPAETTLYRYVLREGRWFRADEPNAVVLSAELADAGGWRVGDEVWVWYRKQLRRSQVVGIAVDNTIFLGGALAGKVFMPRDTLLRMQGTQNSAYFFALGLASREPAQAEPILTRVETRFAAYRPTMQPVYVEIESAQEASRLLTLALIAMVVIVTLVGAFGILNTITLNVLDRRREIAVMRSMGATNGALLLMHLAEGLTLGLLGWLAGVALSYPLAAAFVRQMTRVLFALDLRFTPGLVALSALFTVGLAVLSSLVPALAAARSPTSVALRYE